MGGVVPLGYDLRERRLVINPAEAEVVRQISAEKAEQSAKVRAAYRAFVNLLCQGRH
jgi:hypothetical protein